MHRRLQQVAEEAEALLRFKAGLTADPTVRRRLRWLSPRCCHAEGSRPRCSRRLCCARLARQGLTDSWVGGDACDGWSGVICDGPGHVVELRLSGKGLQGTLAPELGDLSRLSSLLLEENALSGSVPSSFGFLEALQYLTLASNQLTGKHCRA